MSNEPSKSPSVAEGRSQGRFWNSWPMQAGAFLVSLCLAAPGGWFGYKHAQSIAHAQGDHLAHESVRSNDNNEFNVVVETAAGAAVTFLLAEAGLNFALVAMQRRSQEKHA